MTVDIEGSYRLSKNVSLRPERFGALAYSFDTRKLSFLKHPDLVRVLETLADHDSVRETFVAAQIDPARWPSFLKALSTLEQSEMINAV
ncbi:MAG: mycofactocin biosynthesis chaperone MftB [Microthrixaceae bacterium]